MECSLAALIACFSWSGLYVDTGLQFQDEQPTRYYTNQVLRHDGQTYHPGEIENYEVAYGRNPWGTFSIGYEINVSKVRLSLEASHISSLDTTHDRGYNSLRINMRWHPFQ